MELLHLQAPPLSVGDSYQPLELNLMNRMTTALVACASFTLVSTVAHAQSGPWTFSATPYLFLPSIDASFRYDRPTGAPGVDVGPSDYLSSLDYVFMISGEARRDRWSLFSDFMTLGLETDKGGIRDLDFGFGAGRVPISSSISGDARSKVKALTVSFLAGYNLSASAQSPMDVFAGVRYLGLEASTEWQLSAAIEGPLRSQIFGRTGSVTRRSDLWDGVVGLRGRHVFGDRGQWAVPYYVDIGAGDSKFTWQAAAGVTYAFGWGELGLLYRVLSYEQDGNELISDMTLKGPVVSASFRF
jgi:hypothetical protein